MNEPIEGPGPPLCRRAREPWGPHDLSTPGEQPPGTDMDPYGTYPCCPGWGGNR